MNILITGGTGFLGSFLARQLSSGNRVKIIARKLKSDYLSSRELRKFNFTRCDIRNKNSLKKVLTPDLDLVIHCAALINISYEGRIAKDLLETNLVSTINLIDVMVENGVKRLLFCSSMTVYSINNRIPVRESGNLGSIHFYGMSKKWAEDIVVKYAKNNLIKALIIRYPGLYGYPRKDGFIYNVTKKMLKNELVIINTKGLKFWEAMNVEDAAEITKKILKRWKWKKNYEIINCSYGKEIDFIKTTNKIKDFSHSRSEIRIKRPLDYMRFYLDNSKLRSLINFNYDFDRSLIRFVRKHEGLFKK